MPVPDINVFQSTHHSPYKKTFREPTAEYQKRDFTRQYEGPRAVGGEEALSRHNGLSNTKFGIGFQRRRQSDIENPISLQHEQMSMLAETRRRAMNSSRSSKLLDEAHRSGFNLVTGSSVGRGPVDVKSGKKFIDVCAYDDARRSSELTVLKNSGGRYHAVEPAPPRHENNRPSTFSLY